MIVTSWSSNRTNMSKKAWIHRFQKVMPQNFIVAFVEKTRNYCSHRQKMREGNF
jgi:hypothetical protein